MAKSPRRPFPWALLLAIVGTVGFFWVLPRQIPPKPIEVVFEEATPATNQPTQKEPLGDDSVDEANNRPGEPPPTIDSEPTISAPPTPPTQTKEQNSSRPEISIEPER